MTPRNSPSRASYGVSFTRFSNKNHHDIENVLYIYWAWLLNIPFTTIMSNIYPVSMDFYTSETFVWNHDDVNKWKHFPRYWSFMRGIHRSPVNSPRKVQRHGAFMFSLICVWTNGWVNIRNAGDLRRHRAHYVVTVMCIWEVHFIFRCFMLTPGPKINIYIRFCLSPVNGIKTILIPHCMTGNIMFTVHSLSHMYPRICGTYSQQNLFCFCFVRFQQSIFGQTFAC